MTLGFADIHATRIQAWLDRTSRLRERRGGSSLIKTLTASDHIASLLADHPLVEVNPVAGEIDGFVALRTRDDHRDIEAKNIVRAAASDVIAKLQRDVPTLGFEATVGSGENYHQAQTQMGAKYEAGLFDVDAPPTVSEIPFIRSCADCGGSAASALHKNHQGHAICVECSRRSTRSESDDDHPYGSALSELVNDFEGLADPPRQTDVALIFADGNRLGAFKSALKKAHDEGRRDIPELDAFAAMLTQANDTAVRAALTQVEPTKVIPHLSGGDDLLLSLEADKAWDFARSYMRSFAAQWLTPTGASRFPGLDIRDLPTTSVAVVFHHYSHPFPEALELATSLLKHAKRSHRGRTPAVAFSRMTTDGDSITGNERPAPTLDWLEQNSTRLDAISAYPTAQRKTLRATLSTARTEQSRNEAVRKVSEHGLTDLRELNVQARRVHLELGDDLTSLAWLLDLTECWPTSKEPS